MKSINFIHGMLSFLLPLGLIFCLQNRHALLPNEVLNETSFAPQNQIRNYVLYVNQASNQTRKIPIRVLIRSNPTIACASIHKLTHTKPNSLQNDFEVFYPYNLKESVGDDKFIKVHQTKRKNSKFFDQLIYQISARYNIDIEGISLSEMNKKSN